MTENHALNLTVLSRRKFLLGVGALGVGISFGTPCKPLADKSFEDNFNPNTWVSITPDGVITIMSAPSEMGQGVMTVLPALIAEEMDANWDLVRVVQSPANDKIYGNPALFGELNTVASLSVMGYYLPLRLVGAQTREILKYCAATLWGLDVSELSTEQGMVIHKQSGRKIGYGELSSKAKVPDKLPLVQEKDLKPSSEFRLIGKDLARVDIPAKVDGSAIYGIDITLPDMLYGSIVRSKALNEIPLEFNGSDVLNIPGIVKIVPLPNGIGIIGKTHGAIIRAKNTLKVTWSREKPESDYSSDKTLEEYSDIVRNNEIAGLTVAKQGDAGKAIASAHKSLSSEYYSDHIAHVCMEPINATARVIGEDVEIWVSTQSPTNVKSYCAKMLDSSPDRIKVNTTLLGGGFGRREDPEYVGEVVLLAKAVQGWPVKVIWTREDDIRHDLFRPVTAQHIKVGVDKLGSIVGWHQRLVCPSVLETVKPELLDILEGKDPVSAGGGKMIYSMQSHQFDYIRVSNQIDVGSWRGVGAGYIKFATESVIDEIASLSGKDAVSYRLGMLKDNPRAREVMKSVANMANWSGPRQPGRGKGIAFSDAISSYTALIAEVSLDPKDGVIKVHNIWCAIDAGLAIQPRNIVAQLEGGIIMGLGAALNEQININNNFVEQSNFHDYHTPRMSDIPKIEVRVISTDNLPSGVGEAGVPPVAPAIANAVAEISGGGRLRHLPMLPERVKSMLSAFRKVS